MTLQREALCSYAFYLSFACFPSHKEFSRNTQECRRKNVCRKRVRLQSPVKPAYLFPRRPTPRKLGMDGFGSVLTGCGRICLRTECCVDLPMRSLPLIRQSRRKYLVGTGIRCACGTTAEAEGDGKTHRLSRSSLRGLPNHQRVHATQCRHVGGHWLSNEWVLAN